MGTITNGELNFQTYRSGQIVKTMNGPIISKNKRICFMKLTNKFL